MSLLFSKKLSLKVQFLSFFVFFSIGSSVSFANNIQVSNVSLTGQSTQEHFSFIQFDISWENSWRTSLAPNNWDAAWIFVKYRINGGDGLWRHAYIDINGCLSPAGSIINPATDGTGAFIYRSNDGNGPFSVSGVKLKWNYSNSIKNDIGPLYVQDNDLVELKVFAIEMVYVPQGSFYLGGNGTEEAKFYNYPSLNSAYLISSESAEIPVGATNDFLYYDIVEPGEPDLGRPYDYYQGDQTGPVPPPFPKGFSAFYCMKYEITHQQYADFLNTLSRTQQNTRTATNLASNVTNVLNTYVMTNTSSMSRRNSIRCDGTISANIPITFFCDYNGNNIGNEYDDGKSIACGYLSWSDQNAYLDWSCLRPMTELEYEKACRGPILPVANEFAWGSTNIVWNSDFVNAGRPDEVSPNNANCSFKFNTFLPGPTRVGCFATASSNREQSGASYYGIMEMSGNLWERPVTIGKPQGRSFIGNHGDGYLDGTGNHNVTTWPGIDALGGGFRGGHYNNNDDKCMISDRWRASLGWPLRNSDYGGRGVRTAQ